MPASAFVLEARHAHGSEKKRWKTERHVRVIAGLRNEQNAASMPTDMYAHTHAPIYMRVGDRPLQKASALRLSRGIAHKVTSHSARKKKREEEQKKTGLHLLVVSSVLVERGTEHLRGIEPVKQLERAGWLPPPLVTCTAACYLRVVTGVAPVAHTRQALD